MTDPTLDALRAVLAWLTSLWEAGQAPDGADYIAALVLHVLEDASG
jgi:hypothetical protein